MATVNLFFDNRATAANEGMIKIVVTHEREKRRYTTGLKVKDELWDKLPKKGEELDGRKEKNRELKELYTALYAEPDGYYRRARSIVKTLGVNFNTFKDLYDNWGKAKKAKAEKTDLIKALTAKSEALLKNGQVSHGTNFGALAKSLQRFIHKSDCK